MKLVNPRMPNAKFALPNQIIESDANGVIDVSSEEFAQALLKSGYVKIEDFKPEPKAKPEVSKIASESLKVKEEMLAKQVEADKVSSQPENKSEDVAAILDENGVEKDAPKRGWKRGK
jgi:DNA primase large subunit